MTTNIFIPDNSISLFVKDIITIEDDDPNKKSNLPFYADGFPGVMYYEADNALYVAPQNKIMPMFFLYGQTLNPMELRFDGKYKMIVFQLYPFVIESFFDINPQTLNDACYDLTQMQNADVNKKIRDIKATDNLEEWKSKISFFLFSIFQGVADRLDYKVQQGILQIIESNGQLSIKKIRDILNIAERSFERRFLAQVGVTPKQFARIIQFQTSLEDLKDEAYSKLTDIVYKNGFADQSHFIRVFKAFTGATPGSFNNKNR